ncbi:MAG: Gp15 family bacteriophage protein [Lachnospiraceae bacterium]|nr:Gp15 family bacteriophage protein [Lachnospiraceae bacterium]
MIGQLPESIEVGGVSYPIETDFRNILVFFAACSDPELSDRDKMFILLKRLFLDGYDSIPQECMAEAIREANWFINCGQMEDNKKPPVKMIDWEQDEPIIFPAINKIAGMETRALPRLHWWTFIGYFMEIADGTFSTVLQIRQKRSKGKRLEKYEQEFYRNNKNLCDIKKRYSAEEQEELDYANAILDGKAL